MDFKPGKMCWRREPKGLLGSRAPHRNVHIMVTMPGEAVNDYVLIKALMERGMDCARINCAHDDPAVWEALVNHIRRAQREIGRGCRVLMDLGGPKLRTGPIEPGAPVVRWGPRRDELGRVYAPATIWLYPQDRQLEKMPYTDAVLPAPVEWVLQLEKNDLIEFVDARGAHRSMVVTDCTASGVHAESRQSAYVTTGVQMMRVKPRHPGKKGHAGAAVTVGELPHASQPLHLYKGDILVLTAEQRPGKSARLDDAGRVVSPARIACSLPEVFRDVRAGQRVWFDDGKIGGVVRAVSHLEMHIEITLAAEKGARLHSDRGINFPDSALRLPALTEKDLQDLEFVARHADMVGLSFVQSPADIECLHARLKKLKAEHLGVLLKIETRAAFEKLPDLLLAAMKGPAVGVMIARGDLAIECGYERLAEVQEEILWLCEAARLPVIWATQVLEKLAKTGIPSRAEITDAAMGVRAECVMLNKGPHILDAITALDDILRRMQDHQQKKNTLLRRLHW